MKKKLSEIAIENLRIIDNGGTQSDYDRELLYIKSKAEYPNKEIVEKIYSEFINNANNIQHTKSDGCSSLKKVSNLIHPLKDGGHRNKSADYVQKTSKEKKDE